MVSEPVVPRARQTARWVTAIVCVAVVCLVSSIAWAIYSFTLQINNFIRLDALAAEVRFIHDKTGSYPESFAGHRDVWGREVLYMHNDAHFMLVSFGSDGKPDEPDYLFMLTAPPIGVRKHNCFVSSLDTILIDSSPWQSCAK